jgi:hypothetical protein
VRKPVSAGLGNLVSENRPQLGNYMSADIFEGVERANKDTAVAGYRLRAASQSRGEQSLTRRDHGDAGPSRWLLAGSCIVGA